MIKDFVLGQSVSGIALCSKFVKAVTKKGKDYYDVILSDRSGSIIAKCWDISNVINEIKTGCAVKYEGVINEYDGIQLVIHRMQIAETDPLTLCPSTRFVITEMWDSLMTLVNSVENIWCSKLLNHFFLEPEFKSQFCNHSAAVGIHHAYVGGLLEHTLMVAAATARIQKLYKWLNRDLMITAAVLHDIGKLHEIQPFPQNGFSDIGSCIGHVSESAMMVRATCDGIPEFPQIIRNRIIHCILAHHGKLEWGSPKIPAMAEAVVISRMDEMDSLIKQFEEASSKEPFSSYDRHLGIRPGSGKFE